MSKLSDDEILGAAMGLRWYADLILDCLPRIYWRHQKPLREIANHMRDKAIEIELPLLVRQRWEFLNKPEPLRICVACRTYHPISHFDTAPSSFPTRDGLNFNCRESVERDGWPRLVRLPNGRVAYPELSNEP